MGKYSQARDEVVEYLVSAFCVPAVRHEHSKYRKDGIEGVRKRKNLFCYPSFVLRMLTGNFEMRTKLWVVLRQIINDMDG